MDSQVPDQFVGPHLSVDRQPGRLLKDTTQKIDGLSEALHRLRGSFDHGLTVQSVFFSAKITDGVESLGMCSFRQYSTF
jgi:hypothetical protein